MRLAVIVPTLDEEPALRANLSSAFALSDLVVVSDGGSADGTVEEARRQGAVVVEGPRGRGPQLNRGAAAAGDADVYLFLHADTRLPPESTGSISRAVAGGAVGGGFRLRFDSPRRSFHLGAWLVNQRSRLLKAPLGDQGQFVTREAFCRLGGYRPWPIFEDVDLVRRLRRQGRIALLEGPAVTAARRFEQQGLMRTVALNWALALLFLLRVPPERIARLYRQVR